MKHEECILIPPFRRISISVKLSLVVVSLMVLFYHTHGEEMGEPNADTVVTAGTTLTTPRKLYFRFGTPKGIITTRKEVNSARKDETSTNMPQTALTTTPTSNFLSFVLPKKVMSLVESAGRDILEVPRLFLAPLAAAAPFLVFEVFVVIAAFAVLTAFPAIIPVVLFLTVLFLPLLIVGFIIFI